MVGDYPPIMPAADRTLTQPQIWAIVAYLQSLGGEVTVTAADIPDEPEAGEGAAAGVAAGGPELDSTDPEVLVRELCLQCHVMAGEGLDLGPDFDGIGNLRSPEELRLAILDPPAVVSEGYEDMVGLMPLDFGRRLTAEQLEVVVTYLSQLR
jgi:mono/diheme cytochrome c family protein